MYRKPLMIVTCILASLHFYGQNVIAYVNTFIGTANNGNTNPGAVMPWGMVSLSPFNSYDSLTSSSGSSPYYYGNKYIYGFTHLNTSGVGCADMGTFCLMPITGPLDVKQLYKSEYSGEKATPGYYSVNLDRYKVRAELTTSLRSGLICFTFPKGESHILLNMALGLTSQKGATLKYISDTEVQGFKNIGNICGLKTIQTVYFVLRISKQPLETLAWNGDKLYKNFRSELGGDNIGAVFTFQTEENEKIYIKTGISYVSIENARKNLETEQIGFDFEKIKSDAEAAWNEALSKIKVEGGTEDDKIKFYTAIYHTLLHPNIFNDVNDEYRVFESNKSAFTNGVDRYTVFSLWDTYRCLHPFLSLVYPAKQSAMVKSLLGMADENGWLPRWEYAGIESGAMTGDPALPVIADTWLRGIRDFDINSAYELMKHNATSTEKNNYMRPGMDDLYKYSYIPEDASNVLHPFTGTSAPGNDYRYMRERKIVWGSVSTALEYCIADWNVAQLAKQLNKIDDYKQFFDRSMLYKNSFDTSIGFMRPRLYNGNWIEPFDPANYKNNGFTEGNSWNYTFMVPHDIAGVIKLMGGNKKFIEKLSTCFEKKYFDITNEPDLAYPYLFNYVKGFEWKTQQEVSEIITSDFKNSLGGLPGNDDCGALSAWLIFSMMGFYPDCPGNMNYQIASPSFSKITINLDPVYYPGNTFIIKAKNAGNKNCLVQSIKLDGLRYNKFSITHSDIIKGGSLSFILNKKNK
ncbi:MAG TPA: GH92 family glycosyl hydrolase [Chitinophagaceae bacterium]|nr:GH92 family glycosyl hydrolase [Chitinophagaceae bacterium]